MAKKKAIEQVKKATRPPIVTIMGHVDHGKTTLLDVIRKTDVAASEAGGITQHIGAYQIEFKGSLITFIDTPGHAAFAKMRERGAQVTDLVVLVVAANDGVKPQTVESIKHINDAKVPVIVAINKMDAPGASVDTVKGQLTEHQVFTEGYGGQVPAVPVSAKNKEGIDNLLETILLMAELEELTADPKADLEAVIIESELDKSRGAVATLIIKNGTLNTSGTYYLGEEMVKIRIMVDDKGKALLTAKPGRPVQILGFKKVPQVGAILTQKPRPEVVIAEPSLPPPIEEPTPPTDSKDEALATPEAQVEAGKEPEKKEEEKPSFNLILKADTTGTLEAIISSGLHDEITLIQKGVGEINESDIMLAHSTNAIIIGFNVPINAAAKKLGSIEKVKIFTYKIIYELLEFLEKEVLKILEPSIYEEELGVAEVMAIFNIRGDYIAGCKVVSGRLAKNSLAHIIRYDRALRDVKIKSLKQGKTDIPSASSGDECGLIADPQFDFRVGDMIKSYRIVKN